MPQAGLVGPSPVSWHCGHKAGAVVVNKSGRQEQNPRVRNSRASSTPGPLQTPDAVPPHRSRGPNRRCRGRVRAHTPPEPAHPPPLTRPRRRGIGATGTIPSASPCTSSTGARLAFSGERFGCDQRAGECQNRAWRGNAAQPSEQHRHRSLAEPHQRIRIGRQSKPPQFRIDERIRENQPRGARPPPSPTACGPRRSTTGGQNRNHAGTAHPPRRTTRPATHAPRSAPGRSGHAHPHRPHGTAQQAVSRSPSTRVPSAVHPIQPCLDPLR